MSRDLRISFIGDSFVQGVGDPEYRGWVGRVLQSSDAGVTGFNLGIRRDTSEDVLRRCWREVAVRTHESADNRLVLSFGSNDMIEEEGRVRVDEARTLRNLTTLLEESERRAVGTLVVGPPPIAGADSGHLRRILHLADAMSALCGAHRVPFIATTQALADDPTWTSEALAHDGAHPAGAGYQRMADIILAGPWHDWVGTSLGPG